MQLLIVLDINSMNRLLHHQYQYVSSYKYHVCLVIIISIRIMVSTTTILLVISVSTIQCLPTFVSNPRTDNPFSKDKYYLFNNIPSDDDIPDWSNPWMHPSLPLNPVIRNINHHQDHTPQEMMMNQEEMVKTPVMDQEMMKKRGLWNMFRMFDDDNERVNKRNFVPMLG